MHCAGFIGEFRKQICVCFRVAAPKNCFLRRNNKNGAYSWSKKLTQLPTGQEKYNEAQNQCQAAKSSLITVWKLNLLCCFVCIPQVHLLLKGSKLSISLQLFVSDTPKVSSKRCA